MIADFSKIVTGSWCFLLVSSSPYSFCDICHFRIYPQQFSIKKFVLFFFSFWFNMRRNLVQPEKIQL
jgi:hypothetical protein